MDVFAVEGGDEGAVEAVEGGVTEIVGLVLFVADHLNGGVNSGEFLHKFAQMGGRGDDTVGDVLKEVVKDGVLGEQIEHGPQYGGAL